MDSAKLHPFSIESLTSPEKKSDCCGHRSVVSNIHSQHQQTGPLQHTPHQGHLVDPMTNFFPNLVPTDTTEQTQTIFVEELCTKPVFNGEFRSSVISSNKLRTKPIFRRIFHGKRFYCASKHV